MPILQSASVQNVKRLLDLYSVAALRAQWPDAGGTKEEMCFAVAATAKDDSASIAQFLDEYLGCCKQHIYIHSHNGSVLALPNSFGTDSEKIHEIREHEQIRALYLIQFEYNVVLREPLSEITLTFLWPVRVDLLTAERSWRSSRCRALYRGCRLWCWGW